MRALTLLFPLFLFPTLSFSQNLPPGNIYWQNGITEQPCPYNPTETVFMHSKWLLYQTMDDHWDGPVDSSQCLSLQMMNGDWVLDLATIHSQRPIFFRYQVNGQDILMPTNGMYRSIGDYWTDAEVILADSCNDLCSGLLVQYTVPYDADSTVVRTVREVAGQYKELTGCWPTENLEDIKLEEYVMKFTFAETDLTGETLKPFRFYSQALEEWEYQWVLGFTFYEWMAQNETTYRGHLQSVAEPNEGFIPMYYVPQLTDGFPGFNYYTYIEAYPAFSADTALELIITIDYEDDLTFQPYTGVRGGLVDGSDTLRHNLTLEFTEPNVCQTFLVDVIVPDNTTYLMGDGDFDFGNGRSCFMFETGGKLAIKEAATFSYGHDGIGVLGLSRNGHLDLKPNSTLTVDNRMLLVAYTGSEREQAYAHLAPGSTLRFGPNSSLERTLGKNMYLNVYMNGGTLNDEELTPEERKLIRRIYPEVPSPAIGTARISPNPSSGRIMLVLDDAAEWAWPYQITNGLGQVLSEGTLRPLADGRYQLDPDLALPNGLYRIIIRTGDGPVVANWLYQR